MFWGPKVGDIMRFEATLGHMVRVVGRPGGERGLKRALFQVKPPNFGLLPLFVNLVCDSTMFGDKEKVLQITGFPTEKLPAFGIEPSSRYRPFLGMG